MLKGKTNIRLLLFAKHLRALTIPELARAAAQLDTDGCDWPARDGYAVTPETSPARSANSSAPCEARA